MDPEKYSGGVIVVVDAGLQQQMRRQPEETVFMMDRWGSKPAFASPVECAKLAKVGLRPHLKTELQAPFMLYLYM